MFEIRINVVKVLAEESFYNAEKIFNIPTHNLATCITIWILQ